MEREETKSNFERINLRPLLSESRYVFVTLIDPRIDVMQVSLSIFRESEGVSVVISKMQADELSLTYEGIFALITINIRTSLNATGLTAKISTALASAKIPCNVIAAYHHDHLLIPENLTGRAMEILESL